MKPTKYYPFAPAKNFGNWIDDFFNRSIGDFIGTDFPAGQPSVNVIEEENEFRLEVAAPGLQKEDFQINLENGHLTISAKKEQKEEKTEGKYTRREFNYTSFSRSFNLPETVNEQGIKATYDSGILFVALPKKEEAKTKVTRTIDIA
ncbi:MAG TPA: Hsp20/alpha crystallin family protein [Flavilitoribacter sp.]|nr:Hsp20/alpha crystallin family protein [Lewinella sp.]MCB9278301.1 Hsp20/alpha crystallin family protein [Lewinellaceae bacterium]HMQ61969.1 Hsp20/alpha crystallin family protein [Flavilitoribacter sp.]HMQ89427.1 Hsp20/alpha crystallin family protein [Flavilitoribacter sp.]